MPKAFVTGGEGAIPLFYFYCGRLYNYHMEKRPTTILLNVSKGVPADSQPILAWDDYGKCYAMMSRKELMAYYDAKYQELKASCNAKIKRLEAEFEDYKAETSAEFKAYKAEMDAKYQRFTQEIANISKKMVDLVEAIDKGGNI